MNPATEFDLERSYKWLQGRALPRSQQVYQDWARVIGTQRSGAWLAGCSTDAFLDEICGLFSADRAEIEAAAVAFGGVWAAPGAADPADPVCGLYAAYSWAWSPYKRGQIIRGFFRLAPGRRGRLEAVYSEALPGGPIECRGAAQRDGQLLHADVGALRGHGGERLFFSLLAPGRPSNVLCGRLQGMVVLGSNPQPSATRIGMVRVADRTCAPEVAGVCYIPALPTTLADDLGRLGLGNGWTEALADEILRFLMAHAAGGADKVTMTDLVAIAGLLDRMEPRAEARYQG